MGVLPALTGGVTAQLVDALHSATTLEHTTEVCLAMLVPYFLDLVKCPKLEGLILVNGWPDVLTVVACLQFLQLAGAGYIGQPGLDVVQVGDL